ADLQTFGQASNYAKSTVPNLYGVFSMVRGLCCSLLSLLAVSSLLAIDKKPDAEGFVTIFDGTSLDGWKKSTENPDSLQLKDGAIVAHGNRCHLFYVGDEQPFKNFDFKCEVMTRKNSNGGIY